MLIMMMMIMIHAMRDNPLQYTHLPLILLLLLIALLLLLIPPFFAVILIVFCFLFVLTLTKCLRVPMLGGGWGTQLTAPGCRDKWKGFTPCVFLTNDFHCLLFVCVLYHFEKSRIPT